MSPSRSNTIHFPSGLTSTLIQVPSSVTKSTSVTGPCAAVTSHCARAFGRSPIAWAWSPDAVIARTRLEVITNLHMGYDLGRLFRMPPSADVLLDCRCGRIRISRRFGQAGSRAGWEHAAAAIPDVVGMACNQETAGRGHRTAPGGRIRSDEHGSRGVAPAPIGTVAGQRPGRQAGSRREPGGTAAERRRRITRRRLRQPPVAEAGPRRLLTPVRYSRRSRGETTEMRSTHAPV